MLVWLQLYIYKFTRPPFICQRRRPQQTLNSTCAGCRMQRESKIEHIHIRLYTITLVLYTIQKSTTMKKRNYYEMSAKCNHVLHALRGTWCVCVLAHNRQRGSGTRFVLKYKLCTAYTYFVYIYSQEMLHLIYGVQVNADAICMYIHSTFSSDHRQPSRRYIYCCISIYQINFSTFSIQPYG